MVKTVLTLFQGRAADRTCHAITGAKILAAELSAMLNISYTTIGKPELPALLDWKTELKIALPELQKLSEHYDKIYQAANIPLSAIPRCAAGLATIPVVAKYHPDACLVWFDAHADLNTPETSQSGYLGGMVIAGTAGLWSSGLGSGFDLKNLILVGTRDWDRAELNLVDEHDIKVIGPSEDSAESLQKLINGRPVYIHIDCDVLDAGILPSEFQVPNGLTLDALSNLAKTLAACNIVGIEIAELESVWPGNHNIVSPNKLLEALNPLITKLK